jgi:predicted ATPase
LIDTLWGETAPPTASKTVQKYVSRLRKEIGETLVTRGSGYAIEVDPKSTDLGRFELLLEDSEDSDRAIHLTEALELWRGDPFPDLAGLVPWHPVITHLTELRLGATEELLDLKMDAGAGAELVPQLEDLVVEYPTRENFWAQLMLVLYRSGRQSDALGTYARLREHLGNELGIEPSPELQELEEQILLQDPSLHLTRANVNPTNLVAPLTSFVGRKDEMGEVVDLLTESRLVTLFGPAGSGKTRLAIEVARSLLPGFSDGAWFVDLAAVRSPDQIPSAIAASLGLASIADKAIEDVLVDYLRDRSTLLVMDNCEHISTPVAARTEFLLQNVQTLVILATSRERLGVSGEVLLEVSPLPYPQPDDPASSEFEAVRLFTDRAHAANPHLDFDASSETVAEIVRRLDGIPLAIELAAARARNVSLEDMRELLSDRFALLTAPTRDDLGRHQTLQTAVDWSYRLLSEDKQVLFRRLSVFRGGFGIDSAAAVTGYYPLDEQDTLGLLNELVDRSLVGVAPTPAQHTRFSLLETLREYGQTMLDSSEAPELRTAHAAYFCRFAEEAAAHMRGGDHTEALRTLAQDHDNIRKALRWASTTDTETMVRMAIAMSPYWDNVGPRAEGHEWLRRAIDLSTDLGPDLQVKVLLEASEMFSSAHASLPRGFAERALEIAEEAGDEMGEARALRALCWALGLDEQPEEAIRYGVEALQIFQRLDAPWEEAFCMERMGQVAYHDPKWAIDKLRLALRLFREVGDRTREALVLSKLSDRIAQSGGDLEAARGYAEQAIAISDEVGDTSEGAHARLEYGKILRRAGEPEQAIEVLEVALDRLSRTGDHRCSVRTLTALGLAQVEAGDIEAGRETLRESLLRGGPLDESHTSRAALAGLAHASDDPRQAATIYGFVQKLSVKMSVPVSDSSRQKREIALDDLRTALGSDLFDHLWRHGQRMSLEEAVEFALGTEQHTP